MCSACHGSVVVVKENNCPLFHILLKCLWNEILDFDLFGDSDLWAYLFLVTATRSVLYSPSKTVILGKKASGKTRPNLRVTSLARVCHSKDRILKQWESELDSSSDILQCLNAVSSYNDYWILCICLHIKTRL